jgi:metallo-beta-lactamase family protein
MLITYRKVGVDLIPSRQWRYPRILIKVISGSDLNSVKILVMKSVQFFGAAGEVTGSNYLVTGDNGDNVLVDLGMFQGEEVVEEDNFLPLNYDVSSLLGVFITHAHLDHCGRLPLLVRQGFAGKIYTTEATAEIIRLSLLDASRIAIENQIPLAFKADEVEQICSQIKIVEYERPFRVGGFSVEFRNAGHILGSASIGIADSETIVFSGDLGNTPEDLIKPTVFFDKAEYVVMESTYGGKSHPIEDVQGIMQREVNEIERVGGVLLIPAFSVERTQEVLHRIGHLRQDRKMSLGTKIFLDSPMAIEVTELFEQYPQLYNDELRKDKSPFNFSNLTFTETPRASKLILKVNGPKIIIAGSGMMNGGRILKHLQSFGSNPQTRILIVGYQAMGTLGREILEGAKQVLIKDKPVSIRASVTEIETLSSHADQPRLLNWLKQIQGIKKVFITHGEIPSSQALSEKIKSEIGIEDITMPTKGQKYDL